jgi:hypothetical protein
MRPVNSDQDNTRKYSLCLVDDDENELKRFKKAFGDEYYVGTGTNLNKAESDLAATLPRHRFNFWSRQKVNLYVLDMYYPRGTTNTPEQRAQLAKTWSDFCKSNRKLKEVLTNLDQSFDGGRELADQVKRRGFVRTPPFVFFTRKGNLEDAVMAYEQVKAVAVIKKPDPWDDDTSEEAKDTALYDSRETIIRKLQAAITSASFVYQHKEAILSSLIGFITGVLANWVVLFFHK